MAKSVFPSVSECLRALKSGKLQPVYFLAGEDSYSIEHAVDQITNLVNPLIFSDFDKAVFWGGDDKNLADVLNAASAFPFGSEKKLIIIRDFEKFRDKRSLTNYLSSPPDFTVLIGINNGTAGSGEPYKTLASKGFIFEAKELKGKNLVTWVVDYTSEKGKIISHENARMLVDIVGESRVILEDQIEKMITYLSERREINHQDISSLAAGTREYTIFDLLNAVGQKNKSAAFKYALNLLDKGKEPTFIIFMLNKYFTTLSRMSELLNQNISSHDASKALDIYEWTYKDYLNARKMYTEKELISAAEALLKADVSIKTTTTDEKTVISVLLGEILSS